MFRSIRLCSSVLSVAIWVVVPFGCTQNAPSQVAGRAEGEPGAVSREARPDFALESLDGDLVRLSDFSGRVVLLDFWATYCAPCLASLPHLDRLAKTHAAAGLTVLSINVDGPESFGKVPSEVARLGLTLPVLLDSETRVLAEYNPKTSIPFSVLLGRNRAVLLQKEGFAPGDMDALEAEVRSALGQR
jgi:thiol-disulfide isomerase/thioredoxin